MDLQYRLTRQTFTCKRDSSYTVQHRKMDKTKHKMLRREQRPTCFCKRPEVLQRSAFPRIGRFTITSMLAYTAFVLSVIGSHVMVDAVAAPVPAASMASASSSSRSLGDVTITRAGKILI